MTHFFIILACLLPLCVLIQLARSRRLYPQSKNIGADLLEAAGLALAISLGLGGVLVIPHWQPWISSLMIFAIIYFPICLFADWIRKGQRDA